MTLTERLELKAAKRYPIYRGQKVDPETGKPDCRLNVQRKEWLREKYKRELESRYRRMFKTETDVL